MPGTPGSDVHQATVTRMLNAEPSAVWRAWTEPELFAAWFGTPPFHTPVDRVRLDPRVGGEWAATQVGDDGTELPFVGHYLEIDEPRRLVLSFEDPANPSNPNKEIATVTLKDAGGRTEMTLTQVGHLPKEQYPLLEQGYSAFFERMARLLEGE